jgi:hypothetical protein
VSAPSLTAERRCIGFGKYENSCGRRATVRPALLWCQRCEEARRLYLDGQFAKISALFAAPRADERSTDAPQG